jgi:small subunit ribosomal protein S27Ae
MSEAGKAVKKKVSPKVWQFYKVGGDGLSRLKKECPRCGRGYFLAEHADRYTCGKCNYTQYKKK